MYRLEADNTEQRIFDFLLLHDKEFSPCLSHRVDLREYSRKLSLNGHNIFIFENEDIGHACFYLSKKTNEKAFLTSICISKPFQGKSFSRILLKKVEQFAQEKGASQIELEVSTQNDRARLFYMKNGYRKIDDSVKDASSIFMQKLIGND